MISIDLDVGEAMSINEPEGSREIKELTPAVIAVLAEVHDSFLKFLRRRLRNDHDAEEVMQRFYERVVVHASQLRRQESVRIWLRRVLQSALSDHRRRTAVRQRVEADFARKDAATPPPAEELDVIVCACLYRLLPLLKREYEEVLRRADLGSEPHEVIASALDLTPGNLAVRLHRARQALRKALQLSCQTCPIHGFLDCGCEYTKRLRSRRFT
ncbi:MAG: sigma-70 family RNA polymerase sigma factor [Bradyrhizobiaceae bacterium]|nr:MAG: sigma-70 family RNA polymerase sigma factor [Bradyrhizobiaceae bacterium]